MCVYNWRRCYMSVLQAVVLCCVVCTMCCQCVFEMLRAKFVVFGFKGCCVYMEILRFIHSSCGCCFGCCLFVGHLLRFNVVLLYILFLFSLFVYSVFKLFQCFVQGWVCVTFVFFLWEFALLALLLFKCWLCGLLFCVNCCVS